MSRARNIKPGFFKNDTLAECSPLARILFAGLWCEADREGRLEDRPKRLKADCLPYDDCDVDSLLDDLAGRGFIVRYVVDGARYIAIPEFLKHQNPHCKEAASSIPAPDKHRASTVRAPEIPERAGLIPDSGFLIPDSLQEIAPPAAPPIPTPVKADPKGSRLPADWTLPADWRAWAEATRPELDVPWQGEKFRDHFHGKSGKEARKSDWLATWRNWIRSDFAKPTDRRNRAGPTQPLGKTAQAINHLQAMKDELAQDRTANRIPEAPLLELGPDPRR